MADRPVRFELHIRPLMRIIDRDNMLFKFDLWDYLSVRDHADAILQRLSVDMPPSPYGGPWPREWIELFQRWKDEGFPKLDLGEPDSSGYSATESSGVVTLSCRGKTPSSGYRTWFDAEVLENNPRRFVLCWEPPLPPIPGSPAAFRARIRFQPTTIVTDLTVLDSAGTHAIPITTGPSPIVVAASAAAVRTELERMGASRVESTSLLDGNVHRYSYDTHEFEVFDDQFETEISAPSELQAWLTKSFRASRVIGEQKK